ncbi:auxin efflux carrier component 5-like protein [Tanacetum coccineum]
MISWDDIYKVIESMFPLYVALILGYGSVKWWHMFKPANCDAINQLNCYFTMPLYTFDFTTRVNPYKMNYRFLVADVVCKLIILISIFLWTKFTTKGNYPWSITSFSLSSLNNTLVVGVPILGAMYGSFGESIVIQSSILQFTIWKIILLMMYEFRSVKNSMDLSETPNESATDLEGNTNEDGTTKKPSLLILLKMVGLKIAKNPNSYACIFGLAWALVSNEWHVKMPKIVEGSVQILSKAGAGIAMFCMGENLQLLW